MVSRIEDYGLLGDLHTAALVGRDGSIDWLCLPRFDAPACFAALLGDDRHGYWRLAPAAGGPATRRRYRGDSLILETEWDTPDGTVRVVDCMPPRGEAADVVRVVEGVTGRVPVRMALRLRFDYGRIVPWVRHHDGQLAAVAGPDAAWLHTPVPLRGEDFTTYADFEVAAGERVPFVLTYRPSHEPKPRPADAVQALADTEAFWSHWMSRFRYTGGWQEAVRRSLVTLKALTYAPTGGIVAAATTSLPEQWGGPRNWDYRFCWLRDATLTLQALLGTGFVAEARAWREWLLRAAAGDPADLQIMYGIDGTRRLTELTLNWLPGYEGAAPVRIGNAASGQFQLDVWGETLDGLHLARQAGIAPDEDAWDLQRALLDYLEGHWAEPDNGLWEVRGDRRQFVHSKVMAWVGLDRAVRAVLDSGLDGPVQRWRAVRDWIHRDVCERGFDPDRGTFTQFYGSQGLDAALLLLPRYGFLPWSDPRVAGTVDAVRRELCVDGFLLRYRPQAGDLVDGLPGTEGAFVTCSFWLADALAGIGRHDEAERLFERLLGLRNDLGLLAEEYDPATGRQLGNTPQAFSHVGLVNSARHLSSTAPSSEVSTACVP
ncbi:glycoside hydrolase family 15 protein [Dactylosporangium aurantiacum]|uniref:Trehalase n=1 Tax=Dactylosporangium aurantiacum TaxID=35754 RepID=A0A9Q9IN75_9ACTN|nr:glycoside hydrolase family 15 protein [Dactylosporangium aurantiacum]MDG6110419.1 glycoside hydrolase family 15 protein [Dactylosporangium aurantiacum]UWZ58591.1 glycoside hydrolase family 15 protein [Dactylosporangium aurantiacum]